MLVVAENEEKTRCKIDDPEGWISTKVLLPHSVKQIKEGWKGDIQEYDPGWEEVGYGLKKEDFEDPTNLTLETMKEELESGEAQLFDVREPQEWASGHLKLAKLVPLSELMEGEVPKYDRSLLTYVHCAAGVRVHNAAPVLEAMGFERVVPLPEGFATLAGLGFEYE